MVLRQSITHGRGTAIVTSAGIASAILVHGTYTILGLGLIVAQSLIMFTIFKFAGAAYLIWLGISALRAPAPKEVTDFNEEKISSQSWLKAFLIGFLTNLLNPKAVLFFVALFSVLVSAQTAIIWQGVYIISMAMMLLIWFVLVSMFFTAPKVRAGFYRIGKWFNRVTGVALILLALRLLVAQKE